MIGLILSIGLGLAKNLLPTAIGGLVADILEPFAKSFADKGRHEHLEKIAEIKARQAIIVAEQGWWVTAMIRPAIAWPFVIHIGLIVIDTIRVSPGLFALEPWGIATLPAPYDEYEMIIVVAYFGMRPIEKVGRMFAQRRK